MSDETANFVEDLARRERIMWPLCFTALGLVVVVLAFIMTHLVVPFWVAVGAFACIFALWAWAMTACFILQNRIARERGRR